MSTPYARLAQVWGTVKRNRVVALVCVAVGSVWPLAKAMITLARRIGDAGDVENLGGWMWEAASFLASYPFAVVSAITMFGLLAYVFQDLWRPLFARGGFRVSVVLDPLVVRGQQLIREDVDGYSRGYCASVRAWLSEVRDAVPPDMLPHEVTDALETLKLNQAASTTRGLAEKALKALISTKYRSPTQHEPKAPAPSLVVGSQLEVKLAYVRANLVDRARELRLSMVDPSDDFAIVLSESLQRAVNPHFNGLVRFLSSSSLKGIEAAAPPLPISYPENFAHGREAARAGNAFIEHFASRWESLANNLSPDDLSPDYRFATDHRLK